MSKEEKELAFKKYTELRQHYITMRSKAKNAYDFYNFVEKCVLEMEDSENDQSKAKNKEETLQSLGMQNDDL